MIFVSFADIKQKNYKDAITKIKSIIEEVYHQFYFVCDDDILSEQEKKSFEKIKEDMTDVTAQNALKNLSALLKKYYKKNVIILLDEYDTPMQEAYLGGYWEEFTGFIRSMFHSTFKTNPYLERAVMTGITRVSKESIFSDLNNLNVVTTTSEEYATAFGFTQEEVFQSLEEADLAPRTQEKICCLKLKILKQSLCLKIWSIDGLLGVQTITMNLSKLCCREI